MKGRLKKEMQAAVTFVVTLALLAGNAGGILPVEWVGLSVSVKAADAANVPLNREFDETKEAYFELPEHGVVTFESKLEVMVYKVLENGNEEQYMCDRALPLTLRLAPGKYKAYSFGITKINFTPETEATFEKEWNDSFDTANKIEPNLAYTGNLNLYSKGCSEDKDYYKFELQQAGMVQIQYSIKDSENKNTIVLYSEDEEGNTNEICKVADSWTDKTRYSKRYRLPKGIYYIKISGTRNGDANISDYQIKVNYEPETAADHEQEYNDTKETANEISVNTGYTGNIPVFEDKDYYKFTLPATSRVKLKMQVPRESKDGLLSASLYGEDGTTRIVKVNTTTNPVARSEEQLLEAGTYYVLVESGFKDDKDGNDVDYTLTVEAVGKVLVQEITVTSDKTEVHVGDRVQMKAAVLPEDAENKEVTWSCSDKSVAEIDSKGKVTCVGTGNVYITATATDGSGESASYMLTVTKVPVSSILIEAPSITLYTGDEVWLSAVIKPDNVTDKEIVWDSDDESIAEVSGDGVVTCKSAGTVTITATATDGSGVSASKKFTVLNPKSKNNYLSKISISKGKLTPSFKKTKTSYSLVLTKQTSQVVIKAVAEDKKSVIKINGKKMKDNKVTIKLKSGKSKTVKIQVTAENGKTKTYNIKVKRK